MYDLYVNIGGVWKPVSSIHANVGGVWKNASGVYQNVGGTWKSTKVTPEASGGTVTTDGDYKIHTFTSSGSFVVSTPGILSDVLIVAGGGSGGWGYWSCSEEGTCSLSQGAGGGAGGLKHLTNVTITPQTYAITIGAGGSVPSIGARGNNGGNSSAFGQTVIGGGGGGAITSTYDDANGYGQNGGSGGGGGIVISSTLGTIFATAGTGTSGQGYNGYGGTRYSIINAMGFYGGGGGGAGGAGSYDPDDRIRIGVGGAGYTFLGTIYAKGGYGDLVTTHTTNGSGGHGGAAGASGGPTTRPTTSPSAGLPGIVIIRYKYK